MTSSFPPPPTPTPLTFNAPSSFIEPSFWETLYNKKLNVYRLASDPKEIIIYSMISNGNSNSNNTAGQSWQFSSESFYINDEVDQHERSFSPSQSFISYPIYHLHF